jgi:aryl-alcohol dehydrogenase-like predicted oxidoreductase
MEYRRLGPSGLQLSELSLGSWVTYHNQVGAAAAREMLAAAMDAGVNFFDNAEVYAKGQSEIVMGEAFKALGWPRLHYVVSTKFFWGPRPRRQRGQPQGHAQPQVPDAGDRRARCGGCSSTSSTWSSAIGPTRRRRSRRPSGR